jgi:serine/threonine-protein kinase
VYVALDSELNREVALKEILDRHADDPQSRQRFLLEAEITGGLEHPGIVPVYSLGAYADGRPYYAMRFIKGDSLKEAIARFHADTATRRDPGRRSLALRDLLRRFTDVCNAIEYAHTRGVLHRDIKPANIIVGKYGETLVVDWGLAKPLGSAGGVTASDERTLMPSSASGSSETLPGSVLGTPVYMSPEQATGDLDRLGHRSDVYSLGATLYSLLTGKPPFEGDVHEVLGNVQTGDFPRPRQLDATIDKSLEAVCLKAMSLNPDDRYTSPRGLAEGIERWMADEPVTARPERFTERLRRQMRRHRTFVTATAAAALVAIASLSVLLVRESRAKQREMARFDLAMEAIQTFRTTVTGDARLNDEMFRDLRDKLLRSARQFYQKLEPELKGRTDERSVTALGTAYYELGALTNLIGSKVEAFACFERAWAIRERLADAHPAVAQFQRDLGASLDSVANLLAQIGRPSESLQSHARALAIRQKLASAHGGSAFQTDLADSYNNAGSVEAATGRFSKALRSYEQARAIFTNIALGPTGEIAHWRSLASTYSNIGNVHTTNGRAVDARRAYEAALRIRQNLANRMPRSEQDQSALAASHDTVGNVLRWMGQHPEALRSQERALAIRERLARANPANNALQAELAGGYLDLGVVQVDTGQTNAALESYGRALAIFQKLSDANPAATKYRLDASNVQSNIGNARASLGQFQEALRSYEAAVALRKKLADANPQHGPYQSALAASYGTVGNALGRLGRNAGALRFHERALAIRQELAGDNPNATSLQRELASEYTNLGVVQRELGQKLESWERALAIVERLAAADPAVSQYQIDEAIAHSNIGVVRAAAGDWNAALDSYRRARAIHEMLAVREPAVLAHIMNVATFHNRIAGLLLSIGKPSEAEAEYRKEFALRQKLANDHPGELVYAQDLANVQERLGQWSAAEPSRATVVASLRLTEQPDGALLDNALAALGENLIKQRKWPEAEPSLRECLSMRYKHYGDTWPRFAVMSSLGASLLGQKRYAEAEPLVLQGYAGLRDRKPNIAPAYIHFLTEAEDLVLELYQEWGKPEEARAWAAKLGRADLPANVFARDGS